MTDIDIRRAVNRTRFLTLVLAAIGTVLFLVGWNMAAFVPAIVPAPTDVPPELFSVRDVWNHDRIVALPGLFTKMVTVLIFGIGWAIYTKAMAGDQRFYTLFQSFRSKERNDSPGFMFMGGMVVISLFVLGVVPFTALQNYLALLAIKTGLFILCSLIIAFIMNWTIGVRSFRGLISYFNDADSANEVRSILFSMILGAGAVYFLF